LENAFSDRLTQKEISVLKLASAITDKDQSTAGSYMYAMRAPGQSIEEASGLMGDFIVGKTVDFAVTGGEEGLYSLGEAFHALMDQTSPAHAGFQVWYGVKIGTLPGAVGHFLAESTITDAQLAEIIKILRDHYDSAQRLRGILNPGQSESNRRNENKYMDDDWWKQPARSSIVEQRHRRDQY
jgi:hypothetical protein